MNYISIHINLERMFCKKSHSEESEVLILSFNGKCCCRKIIFRERANLDKVNPAVI